jgi:dephospho-CoA kinase
MNHQWPERKKLELANFVIQNDGKTMLIPQVLEIHKKLLV